MPPSYRDLEEVAERQMCCGCGACAFTDPDAIEIFDSLAHGRRPRFRQGVGRRTATPEAFQVCPGIALDHREHGRRQGILAELLPGWGPVLEVWEGYASDAQVRFAGSSGGVATGLSLHSIEQGGMHGVLHIAPRPDIPYLNHTVLSTRREELLAATGSRYAPASPCDSLHRVESAPAPCVFIGKPCDVAATWKARALRSRLDGNLGLTIAIFCAGTPSTEGTLAMLRSMGVESGDEIVGLRYRGNGWPGRAEVTLPGGDGDGEERRSLSYEESWGEILQKHRQWRCALCADHTGEFADIAVGDPWYRPTGEGDPGRSLVIVRTERGRRLLAEAMESGTLTLERVDPALLPASQPNLLRTRGAIWGRLLVCRWMGAAVPRYLGVPALRFWWSELGLREKAQSIYGTVKRVIVRRLRRRIDYRQAVAPARRSSSSHSAPSPAEAVEGERLVGAQKGKA